eukprot:1137726-Pelagomonas_calceolata.AAC.3
MAPPTAATAFPSCSRVPGQMCFKDEPPVIGLRCLILFLPGSAWGSEPGSGLPDWIAFPGNTSQHPKLDLDQ